MSRQLHSATMAISLGGRRWEGIKAASPPPRGTPISCQAPFTQPPQYTPVSPPVPEPTFPLLDAEALVQAPALTRTPQQPPSTPPSLSCPHILLHIAAQMQACLRGSTMKQSTCKHLLVPVFVRSTQRNILSDKEEWTLESHDNPGRPQMHVAEKKPCTW